MYHPFTRSYILRDTEKASLNKLHIKEYSLCKQMLAIYHEDLVAQVYI
jgi:hypothetical protein